METKTCPECGQQFDWAGVQRADVAYCCAACAAGEPCVCVLHSAGESRISASAPATGPGGAIDSPDDLPED